MKALKPIVDRDIVIFTFFQNRPIAFYVNIPELNEIFKYVNGNLNWWGKLIFLYRKKFHPPKMMTGIVNYGHPEVLAEIEKWMREAHTPHKMFPMGALEKEYE